MTEDDEQKRKKELVKNAMEEREKIDNIEQVEQERELAGQSELMKNLEEDKRELFRDSEDGTIEELKDDAEDLRDEAIVSDEEMKDEYVRKITETHGLFRLCIPKEIVREKNLRPKDRVAFTTDDTNDNCVVLKIYFDKDPTNFRIPFEKWEKMKYGGN